MKRSTKIDIGVLSFVSLVLIIVFAAASTDTPLEAVHGIWKNDNNNLCFYPHSLVWYDFTTTDTPIYGPYAVSRGYRNTEEYGKDKVMYFVSLSFTNRPNIYTGYLTVAIDKKKRYGLRFMSVIGDLMIISKTNIDVVYDVKHINEVLSQ